MPATQIAAHARFYMPGTSKCIWIPTIAASNKVPTRAEINAGLDVTRQIMDVDGWQVTSESIETPDMSSTFTGSIGGRTSAEDSSIMFYGALDGADIRTTMIRDVEGFIDWMFGGDVAGYKMDIFPVRVASVPKQISVGDEPFRLQVQFNVTSAPVEDAAIPA